MNVKAISNPTLRIALCLALIALCFVATAAPSYAASTDGAGAADAVTPLFADLMHTIVGNRARMIQVSFICIAIGIFILCKK